MDDHRESIASWEYERYFDMVIVNDGMIHEFLDYGGYGLTPEDLPSDQFSDLQLILKAAIAKNIWGFDAYTAMLLDEDPILKEVVKNSTGTLE